MTVKHLIIPLLLGLLVACGGNGTDYEPQEPTSGRQSSSTPSAMDLMCTEAIEEMRRLIKKGGINITRYDPRGQLASLVETCIQEGKGN